MVLLVLLVVTNFQDGVVYRQTWLPLVNPLEEGAAFALLGLVVFIGQWIATIPRCLLRLARGLPLLSWRLASGGLTGR